MPRPKIDKAGVYSIPLEFYHDDCCVGPSVSSSDLRTIILASPADYYADSPYNPDHDTEDEEKEAEKASFILGRAAHHLLLGEDNFSTEFIMRPEELDDKAWHSNRTVCREWLDEQKMAGRTVVTPKQIKVIRGMAKSLAAEPLVMNGLLNGQVEKSMIWQDKKTGVWLKSRPDVIPTDSGDVCDLKTSRNFGFNLDRDVSNYRYDMQAALVKWGLKATLDIDMASFSLCFVRSKKPYSVEVLTLVPADIADAEKDLRVAIDTFAWCYEHSNWFGPAGTQRDARWVSISEYAKRNAEFRRDYLRKEIETAEKISKEAEGLRA